MEAGKLMQQEVDMGSKLLKSIVTDLLTEEECSKIEADFPIRHMSPEEFQTLSKKEQEDYEVEQVVMNRRRQKAMGPFLYARQNDIDKKDEQMDMEKESSEYPGYTNGELMEVVTFLSRKWDDKHGCFASEDKNVRWCLDKGYWEVEPGTWAGYWFWDKYPDIKPHVRSTNQFIVPPEERINRNVTAEVFQDVKENKEEGNQFFKIKMYSQAVKKYDKALNLLGGEDYTMFLSGEQREEATKILSNRAECNICLDNNTDASLNASSALALDKDHARSLLRRARANYNVALQKTESSGTSDNLLLGIVQEDLDRVITMGDEGVDEANEMKEIMKHGP